MIKLNSTCLLFTLLFSFYGFSALKNSTSEIKDTTVIRLLNELESLTKDDSAKVDKLIDITKQLNRSNTDKAIVYCKQALNIAKTIGYKRGMSRALNMLAYTYEVKAEFKKSVEYYFKALRSIPDSNYKKRAIVLNNIGGCYIMLKDYEQAGNKFNQALKLSKKAKDTSNLIRIHNELGFLKLSLKDTLKAQNQFQKAISLALATNDKEWETYASLNYTNSLNSFRYYDTVVQIYKNSIDYFNSIGDSYGATSSLLNLASVTGEHGEYETSIKMLLGALATCEKNGFDRMSLTAHKNLEATYHLKNDFKNAYEQLHLVDSIEYVMLNETKLESIAEIETKYQTEKKNKELVIKQKRIALLQKDKEINSKMINGLSIGIFLLILIALLFFRQYRQKKRSKEKETQLQLMNYNSEIEILRSKINARLDEPTLNDPFNFEHSKINSYLTDQLSEREFEILVELKKGCTNKEIAETLHLSVNTIKTHLNSLYIKLDVKNRTQAVHRANSISTPKKTE